ncbi:MAG: heavy metal translocating P-type ATPase [Myxococcales bacterium]|nr:heavy metal translocating P-type ATPase [Myxococcales bacterium]
MTINPHLCSHCGLVVPTAFLQANNPLQFCCQGCETVYAVIHEQGLDRYYALRGDANETGRPVKLSGRTYAEFDEPSFLALYAQRRTDELISVHLYLQGIHCAACLWLVERVASTMDGVIDVRLDIGRSSVHITYAPAVVRLSHIAQRLDSVGYPSHPFRGADREFLRRKEDRALLMRIGVAGAVAGNVMLLALALYSGMFSDMEAEYSSFFRWVSLVVTLPSVLWSASVFYRGAWAGLRARLLHMDLPISIGILTGFVWGAYNTIVGRGEIYFDSLAVLVFLLLVGRWLQQRQKRRATDATELFFALAPSTARLVDNGIVRDVPIESITPGMVVEVRPGDFIPVDGDVTDGTSAVDCAVLTGEAIPVWVQAGDKVNAGTTNVSGRLRIVATGTGEQTRVGKLLLLVEEAMRKKAPIVAMADRISAYFVAVVLVLAAVTIAMWWSTDVGLAIDHAVALLIVTCPCALGLATPLAVSAAIGKAARHGILIKGEDVLERLARKGTIWFDKTGTLTEGRLSVSRWVGDDKWKPIVRAMENHSGHPIARGLVAGLPEDPTVVLSNVRETFGGGLEADFGRQKVIVGNPNFVQARCGGAFPDWVTQLLDGPRAEAKTTVLVASEGIVRAAIELTDPVRHDAVDCVRSLETAGYQIGILSGDDERVVSTVGSQLAISPERCFGRQTPEQKLEHIRRAAKQTNTFMVGDGVNDAGALAEASVGIGVHGGAEACLTAADVYLARDGIALVADLVEGSRRTMRVIRRNVLFALSYNLLGVVLSMTGLINPMIAAILMPFSSLTVVSSSYKAKTFGAKP